MRLILTVIADCDPPPRLELREEEMLDRLLDWFEDQVAGVLLDAGGGFSIECKREVEI